jgi:hypothetical protein|uniref:Uncharacterized protein n=1 Tax=viral metagenome TaxID=1070528 RepID=A0A6C0IUT7_9ZZZZ
MNILARMITGVPEGDFLIPYECLRSEEERKNRKKHINGATAWEFYNAIHEHGISYKEGVFLKCMCIRHKRMDLLQVILRLHNNDENTPLPPPLYYFLQHQLQNDDECALQNNKKLHSIKE